MYRTNWLHKSWLHAGPNELYDINVPDLQSQQGFKISPCITHTKKATDLLNIKYYFFTNTNCKTNIFTKKNECEYGRTRYNCCI